MTAPSPRAANDDGARWIAGLDLGQAQDFTALVVLLRTPLPEKKGRRLFLYQIKAVERFDLGTPYDRIVEFVVERFSRPPLSTAAVSPRLVLDFTGVGRPVMDMFTRAQTEGVVCPGCNGEYGLLAFGACFTCGGKPGPRPGRLTLKAHLIPVTITGSQALHALPDEKSGGWTVPKKDLVGALQVLMGSKRLRLGTAPGTSLAKWGPLMVREFENFRVKITAAANETYEAWREREHDDLVLATALSCYVGERCMGEAWFRRGDDVRPTRPPEGHTADLPFSDPERPKWQPGR